MVAAAARPRQRHGGVDVGAADGPAARRRLLAVDLPIGLSDPLDYGGRSLRAHAVAQLTSLLDALELGGSIVGTSLGAMWALCLALDAPMRVSSVAALGVPAVALSGMHGDPFFTALSTPGLRQVVARLAHRASR